MVESARRGDVLSFQMLVERYQTPILRYLYRLTGDSELARDLTMRTFVVAHQKLKHLDLNLRFEAWLHRLATQQALSALRVRRLARLLPGRAASQLSVEDDREGQLVQQALLRLPGGMAAALLLWSIGGFSYAEIARVLGTSERGVRERIGQARSRIIDQDTAGRGHGGGDALQPLLSAYMDHQLSGDDHIAVQQHLATCVSCTARLASLQELDRRLAHMKGRGPSASVAYDVTRTLRGEKLPAGQRRGRRAWCALAGAGCGCADYCGGRGTCRRSFSRVTCRRQLGRGCSMSGCRTAMGR